MKTIPARTRVAIACALATFLCLSCAADDRGVFVTKTGTKYHLGSCKALSKSKIPLSLEDAIARGYAPCELCHPPVPQGDTPGAAVPAEAATRSRDAPFTMEGTVVSVTDGDTVVVLSGTEQFKIRLNGIDCPEHNQAYGQKAKEYTASLIAQKAVTVTVTGRDRYGRYLGDIFLDGVSVNALLVEAGFAWHYRQYSKDGHLEDLERAAREGRKGLWQDANPVAPWDFRKKRG